MQQILLGTDLAVTTYRLWLPKFSASAVKMRHIQHTLLQWCVCAALHYALLFPPTCGKWKNAPCLRNEHISQKLPATLCCVMPGRLTVFSMTTQASSSPSTESQAGAEGAARPNLFYYNAKAYVVWRRATNNLKLHSLEGTFFLIAPICPLRKLGSGSSKYRSYEAWRSSRLSCSAVQGPDMGFEINLPCIAVLLVLLSC